jgi:hypothetical protein
MTDATLPLRAVHPVRLHILPQTIVFITTTLLVCISVVLFMIDSTSNQVGTMLNTQNAASLKLWQNLKYYEQYGTHDESLPPGLMDDVVEFSRTTANIIKTAHRLTFSHIFAPSASWERVKEYIKPVDGDKTGLDHLTVVPYLKSTEIVNEGMYQIRLYQAIREYAQDRVAIDKSYVAAVSTYILPCLYALLGAFLYTCRSGAHRKHLGHSSRYAMAFILGATISVFSSLLPKDLLLSPLAMAFLGGYSIDAFTSRLDALVAKMMPPSQIGSDNPNSHS